MRPSIALTRAGSANAATMIPMRMSQTRLNACSEVRQCASVVLLSQLDLSVAGHDLRVYRDNQVTLRCDRLLDVMISRNAWSGVRWSPLRA
jgi:hypothetical protein